MKGFIAWCIWIFIHIAGLINFRNRLRTLLNWLGYYISEDQYFRMIIKPNEKPYSDDSRKASAGSEEVEEEADYLA